MVCRCLPLFFFLALTPSVPSQQFGPAEEIISPQNTFLQIATGKIGAGSPLDLVFAGGNTLSWLPGNGEGQFGAVQTVFGGFLRIGAFAIGDIDGDGDLDFVTSDAAFPNVLGWHENLGGGVFVTRTHIDNLPGDNADIVLADFDMDGDLDIVTGGKNQSGHGALYLYQNSGNGTFVLNQTFAGGSFFDHITSGDLDGDGDADLFTADESSRTVFWFENQLNSAGRFQFYRLADLLIPRDVEIADLDTDGNPDLVVASAFSGQGVHWYRSLGGGSFAAPMPLLSLPSGQNVCWDIEAEDIDNDGDLDISASYGNLIEWARNDGNATFGSREALRSGVSTSTGHVVADFDGDLFWDIATIAGSAPARYYENLGIFDADGDGLADELEDVNANGLFDPGETDWLDQDTDDDGLSDGEEYFAQYMDPRWLEAPSGNFYRLAPPATWSQSSGNARAVGAELASIGSVQEEIWLLKTFGSTSETAWIGLNDFGGNFEWSNGSALTYTHWGPGEPSASFVAAFVGGDAYHEPGAWYTEVAGASARRSVWELSASSAPVAYTDPLNWDSDGDGLSDGMELGLDVIIWDGDLDGDGNPDVGGTDPALFVADLDPLSTTSPIDTDSDDDGLADGLEDVNGDGAAGPGETIANDADSDLDGLPDGIELGLEYGTVDTDGRVFLSDDDPSTTTDPLNSDSDGGGVPDGVEDHDQNGAADTWDTDPNDPNDEALAVYFSGIIPGGRVHIEVWNATPFETVIPAYSLKGPGPSPTGLGLNVDLSRPIALMDPFLTDAAGRASEDRLPVPANAPLGLPVWFQAVEVPLSSSRNPRASNPVLLPVGAN